jgi:hypothetical protein
MIPIICMDQLSSPSFKLVGLGRVRFSVHRNLRGSSFMDQSLSSTHIKCARQPEARSAQMKSFSGSGCRNQGCNRPEA